MSTPRGMKCRYIRYRLLSYIHIWYIRIFPLSWWIQEISKARRTCRTVLGIDSKSDADCPLLPWFPRLGKCRILQSTCWTYVLYYTLESFPSKITHTHTLITHTFKKGFSESLRFPVPHGPMALGLRAPSDHGDLSWRTPMQTKRGRRPPVNCQQFGATTLSALSLAKIWRKQLHLIYPIIPILNNLDMNRELLKL